MANFLQNISSVFLDPRALFSELNKKNQLLPPLLLLVCATLAIRFYYVQTVDLNWLTEHTLNSSASSSQDAKEIVNKLTHSNALLWATVLIPLLTVPLTQVAFSIYYWLISRLNSSNIPLEKWFAFSCWVSFPSLVAIPLMVLQISSSGGRIALEDINMLSLNFLIFHEKASSTWYGVFSSINLLYIWNYLVAAIGLKEWLRLKFTTSTFLASAPLLLFYGVWSIKVATGH